MSQRTGGDEIGRDEIDRLGFVPILFDALIEEQQDAVVFRKTLRLEDPGVSAQRVLPRWPHHLPGELIIALTGQAAVVALRRKGLIGDDWRGHGVRITDARFSAPVLLGETFYTRVEIGRLRRLRHSLHARLRFRMWKPDTATDEIEVFHSQQDAMFFPGV